MFMTGLIQVVLALVLALCRADIAKTTAQNEAQSKVPLIYVYTVDPKFCQYGVPDYMRESMQHSLTFQKHARVILGANFNKCPGMRDGVAGIKDLELIDITDVVSPRTKWYASHSKHFFASDHENELWISSALRFFNIEDMMHHLGLDEAFHVEGDNLLYGQVHQAVPILKSHYPLAVVPQAANKGSVTASVLWISKLSSFREFTDYLMDLLVGKFVDDLRRVNVTQPKFVFRQFLPFTSLNATTILPALIYPDNICMQYAAWLRRYSCCRRDGLFPDENGNGLRPFSINEMTMLAHYEHLFPTKMINLPMIPYHEDTPRRRPFSDVKVYARGGSQVGTWTSDWVWDGGSWGQYLGGTHKKRGTDLRFIDPSHVQGQAIIQADCLPKMVCDTILYEVQHHPACRNLTTVQQQRAMSKTKQQYYGFSTVEQCYTVPIISCNNVADTRKQFPIFNLHVHSKLTSKFVARPCACALDTPERIPPACQPQEVAKG
eukprot:gene3413-2524_t